MHIKKYRYYKTPTAFLIRYYIFIVLILLAVFLIMIYYEKLNATYLPIIILNAVFLMIIPMIISRRKAKQYIEFGPESINFPLADGQKTVEYEDMLDIHISDTEIEVTLKNTFYVLDLFNIAGAEDKKEIKENFQEIKDRNGIA